MNRLNHFDSSDSSMIKAYRVAAMARYVAGCIVLGAILLASALTGQEQQVESDSRVIDARVGQSAALTPTDANFDAQLHLNPSEIMFYSSNVHG